MKSLASFSLVAALALLGGCGRVADLSPPPGNPLPVKPLMARTTPTSEQLLTAADLRQARTASTSWSSARSRGRRIRSTFPRRPAARRRRFRPAPTPASQSQRNRRRSTPPTPGD